MDDGLIERLKTRAASSPDGSRGKVLFVSSMVQLLMLATVAAIALLVYSGLQLGSDLFRIESLVYLGLTAVAMTMAAVILGMFVIRLEAPEGRPITREEAPRLFETLDKMCKKLDGPPIDRVVITREYGAMILPLRARAISGRYTNYLVIGMPYMLGVPAKEMLSAVARDYSYLCGSQGKLAASVFRQSRTFAALSEQIRRKSKAGLLGNLITRLLGSFIEYHKANTAAFLRHDPGCFAGTMDTEGILAKINEAGRIQSASYFHAVRSNAHSVRCELRTMGHA
jgi:hypothetical protein